VAAQQQQEEASWLCFVASVWPLPTQQSILVEALVALRSTSTAPLWTMFIACYQQNCTHRLTITACVNTCKLNPLLVMCCHCRYALVGLEQTAESTCLPEFKFPSKTVSASGWVELQLAGCCVSPHDRFDNLARYAICECAQPAVVWVDVQVPQHVRGACMHELWVTGRP
jgi:hypothetical protein